MADKITDIMTLLADEFDKRPGEVDLDVIQQYQLEAVAAFVTWARNYLDIENSPISQAFIQDGVALRLKQGQVVCFNIPKSKLTENFSIPITNGLDQTDKMPQNEAINIFGEP